MLLPEEILGDDSSESLNISSWRPSKTAIIQVAREVKSVDGFPSLYDIIVQ